MSVSDVACVDRVDELCFENSLESVQAGRVADSSRYIVPSGEPVQRLQRNVGGSLKRHEAGTGW